MDLIQHHHAGKYRVTPILDVRQCPDTDLTQRLYPIANRDMQEDRINQTLTDTAQPGTDRYQQMDGAQDNGPHSSGTVHDHHHQLQIVPDVPS